MTSAAHQGNARSAVFIRDGGGPAQGVSRCVSSIVGVSMIGADNERQLWGWSLQSSVHQRHAVTQVVSLVQGTSSTATIKSFARRDGCEDVLLGPRIREFTERCVN